MKGPSPSEAFPVRSTPEICFLKNVIRNPNIIVGEYTYYHASQSSPDFEQNVLYHYPFIGDKLIIGKFCAIAQNVKFIMNGANHKLNGISTYPFQIFGRGWEKVMPPLTELPLRGDTVIENDVWLGFDSLVMPGVRIGNGAIIASRAVVTANVPPFAVVGGNPARILKMRFSEERIAQIEAAAWWNWPTEHIARHLDCIVSGNVDELLHVAEAIAV